MWAHLSQGRRHGSYTCRSYDSLLLHPQPPPSPLAARSRWRFAVKVSCFNSSQGPVASYCRGILIFLVYVWKAFWIWWHLQPKCNHLLHISSFSCSGTGDFNRPEKGGKAQQAWDAHRVVTNPTLKGCEEGLPFSAPLTLSGSKLRPRWGGNLKLQLLSRAGLQVFCVLKACVLSLTQRWNSFERLTAGRGSMAKHHM